MTAMMAAIVCRLLTILAGLALPLGCVVIRGCAKSLDRWMGGGA